MNNGLRVAGVTALLALEAAAQATYTLDVNRRCQRIDNFGASDCWTAQVCGRWPDAKRERIAEWLFSTDAAADGQPRGIGLSLWRFNVGAGSAEQGDASGIKDPSRRTECFLRADGTYDWERQAGQRWFLQAAKQRGVKQFLAFCNSAPVHLTDNGLANNRGRPKDGSYNLKADRYGAFAGFLADVLAGLGQREGLRFSAVSPFNEPEWEWDSSGQEGSPARVSDMARLVRLLDRSLTERRLDARILVTESGKTDYLISANAGRPAQSSQIEALFGRASTNAVAGLPHVPRVVAGHSYWTTAPNSELLAKRVALRKKLDAFGLGYWQTEVCIMANDKEIGGGNGKDLGMRTALYVARIIHYDLCVAGASAWHWWLAMTASDYKDGLIYVTPRPGQQDGEISDSKLLWVLGHYSRFIRPGAVRVDVRAEQADANAPVGLMVSAYVHEAQRSLCCVLVNYAERDASVRLAVPALKVRSPAAYVTSGQPGENLKPRQAPRPDGNLEVPARSVMTVTWRY